MIPVGPVVLDGDINFRRYLVKFHGSPGVNPADVSRLLIAQGFVIHEIRYGNFDRPHRAFSIAENGFEAYLEFENEHQAINMRDSFELDGHQVFLWHLGRRKCAI